MNDDLRLARAICEGTFDILCPTMELLLCPGYHQTVARGSGTIRSDKDGRLSFRMAAKHDWPPHDVLRERRTVGEMYEPDDHVMLRAVDVQGREWRTNWLLVHLTRPSEWMNGYIQRSIDSMTLVRKRLRLSDNSLVMYIPRQSEMPFDKATTLEHKVGAETIEQGWSIDHHSRNIGGSDVEFRKIDGGWLEIEVC